ncbi:Ion-translocating oxidoreductase complex subunit A [Nymphon striatum]|nr:Ion-translocating oxidoreductase complex subunit A [Nymphon striatum]
MTEYLLIIVGTVWVNNIVLAQFLGLCPFMGVSRKLETAMGMGLATTFILVIAAIVGFTELVVHKTSPLLHNVLGIYLPLITTNCAVLGVALLNVQQSNNFIESALYGFGSALGFTLVLVLFAAMRERLAASDVPEAFQGNAIGMITAGLMALAVYGFHRPYAEAIAKGEAPINKCPPGGETTILALADLLDVEPMELDEEVEAAPDTPEVQQNLMHTVIESECTGCELCLPPCPVDCIVMQPIKKTPENWKWVEPKSIEKTYPVVPTIIEPTENEASNDASNSTKGAA